VRGVAAARSRLKFSAITFWRSSDVYIFIICCISTETGAAFLDVSAAARPVETKLPARIKGVNRTFFLQAAREA